MVQKKDCHQKPKNILRKSFWLVAAWKITFVAIGCVCWDLFKVSPADAMTLVALELQIKRKHAVVVADDESDFQLCISRWDSFFYPAPFSSFCTENVSSLQEPNWDHRSRRQERWPLDHHLGEIPSLWKGNKANLRFPLFYCFSLILFSAWPSENNYSVFFFEALFINSGR